MTGPKLQIDNANTTLATGYTAGDATISVASTVSYGTGYGQFPVITGGQFFRVKCGTVIFKVTAVNTSTNVWNVTVVETTDASQGANMAVMSVFTAAAANNLTQSGFITDSGISASAAIAKSKLAALGIVDADVASGATIAPTKIAGTAVITTDSRRSYARTPLAHEATHLPGETDALPWGTILGSGTDASKPAAGVSNAGYLWIATDTNKIYQSSGSAWNAILTATSTSVSAATTSALATVEIDVAPASGNPFAVTLAGLTPAATAGALTTGTWQTGQPYIDSAYALYICSAGGTPGTWHQIGGSGSSTLAGDTDVAITSPARGRYSRTTGPSGRTWP